MRVGIVGGGIAGLTAGYELSKKGHQVAVFERGPEPGGQVATFELGGERLEIFYHHLFTSDTDMIGLLGELGLADKMTWIESKVGFWCQNRIHPFVTPSDLLRFTPISLLNRIRLGLVGLYLGGPRDWRKLERISAKDWIIRWAGRKNYEVVWGPLLQGKFGQSADEVSMAWFWGKIRLRFTSRKGRTQRERLCYLKGSYGLATDALVRRISESGGVVHTGSPVKKVVVKDGVASGLEAGGKASGLHSFDAIIATTSSPVFLDIAPQLAGDYAARLRQTRYQAALCMVLALKKPLSNMYWLNISDPSVPFVAAVEHTNFVDSATYGGKRVLYISNYLAQDAPLYKASSEQLLTAYLPHLRRINPEFERGWIEDLHVFREDAAQPIVTTNFSKQVPEHRTPIKGLYLANTTQIYPEDRGLNYSVRLGRKVSNIVQKDGTQ